MLLHMLPPRGVGEGSKKESLFDKHLRLFGHFFDGKFWKNRYKRSSDKSLYQKAYESLWHKDL